MITHEITTYLKTGKQNLTSVVQQFVDILMKNGCVPTDDVLQWPNTILSEWEYDEDLLESSSGLFSSPGEVFLPRIRQTIRPTIIAYTSHLSDEDPFPWFQIGIGLELTDDFVSDDAGLITVLNTISSLGQLGAYFIDTDFSYFPLSAYLKEFDIRSYWKFDLAIVSSDTVKLFSPIPKEYYVFEQDSGDLLIARVLAG